MLSARVLITHLQHKVQGGPNYRWVYMNRLQHTFKLPVHTATRPMTCCQLECQRHTDSMGARRPYLWMSVHERLLRSLRLPSHLASHPMTFCLLELRWHTGARRGKEVLFIDAWFGIDQTDSFVCFELYQSYTFEHTDSQTDRLSILK